jgi:hypothetical protein
MRTLKVGLEKPNLIWALIVIAYVTVFWTTLRHAPPEPAEQATYDILRTFSESSFPPRIHLIRELPDWGHIGYYALLGPVFHALHGDLEQLRVFTLVIALLALFVFARLGYRLTYRGRLNPLWASLALVLLAANPYLWLSAFHLSYDGLLLLFLLASLLLVEAELPGWSSIAAALAVLVDWRALCLAAAFVITRLAGARSRLLRPERILGAALPFAVATLPLFAWDGIVPQGQAREWWHAYRAHSPTIHPDTLFYAMAGLPIYGALFTWSWALRARSRAITVGATAAAILIPFYFLFPIRADYLEEARSGATQTLGLLDAAATAAAGPYKNLVIFVPWLAGAFLIAQLLLMDALDRSKILRYFLIFFFLVLPISPSAGDRDLLIAVPIALLLSLSESLVGEEGKVV